MNTKKCTGECGQEKPLSEFYKAVMNTDGYNKLCIDCYKKRVRKRSNKIRKSKIKYF